MSTDGVIESRGMSTAWCPGGTNYEEFKDVVGLDNLIEWIWQIEKDCPVRGRSYYYQANDKAINFSQVRWIYEECQERLGYMDAKRLTPNEVIDILNL